MNCLALPNRPARAPTMKGSQQYLLYPAMLAILSIFTTNTQLAQAQAVSGICYSLDTAFPNCPCSIGAEVVYAVVDCSNQGLTSVPSVVGDPLPADVVIHEFKLNGNDITTLDDNSFQGVRVEKLDLSGNRINSVSDGAFGPLAADLVELQMDGDGTAIPDTILRGLSKLEVVKLRGFNSEFLGDTGHQYFIGLYALKHITLHDWKIEGLEDNAFLGLNNVESLTLTKQNLFSIPQDALSAYLTSLTALKISETPIQTISDSALDYLENLIELDLSNNQIQTLEQNCFNGLGALKRLYLNANNFHINDPNLDDSDISGLRDLPSLEELDLSHNEAIYSIPSLSQLGTTSQSLTVTLIHNQIDTLEANVLSGIGSYLRGLELAENEIANIDGDAFSSLTNLQHLDLSRQFGVSSLDLPESLSQSAHTLTHLAIGDQLLDISTLWDRLKPLVNLEVLDMRKAGLSSFPDFALQEMTRLQFLNLEENSISELKQESLVGPRGTLKELLLSENSITTLPSCLFADYTSNSFPILMSLKSSALVCDCRLKWLLDAADDQDIQFTPGHEPACANLNNEALMSKAASDICSDQSYSDAPCESYYSTGDPDGGVTQAPSLLTITLAETTENSVTLAWVVSDESGLLDFTIRVSDAYGDSAFQNTYPSNVRDLEVGPLRSDTSHTACVIARFQLTDAVTECRTVRTQVEGGGASGQGSDSSNDSAIIVGIVVGVVLLVLILIAIFYLLVLRRKSTKSSGELPQTQPRAFAKSELPSMTEDSRSFTRPKSRDHHDNGASGGMQVVAISDGLVDGTDSKHASNGSAARVGRAAMLNNSDDGYKLMAASSGSYISRGSSVTSDISGAVGGGPRGVRNYGFQSDTEQGSEYENDHRSLPDIPDDHHHPRRHSRSRPRQPGYYNEAFEENLYDEIGQKPFREVTV